MIKIIFGILLLCLSGLTIMLDVVGNHGHFMFRPHMTEDWIIFGFALLTGLSGLVLLYKNRQKRKE